MLSKTCVYSLRAIIFIAHNASENSKLGIKEISEEVDIPIHYLGKILQRLRKNNILQSVKGPHGGFYLEEKAKEIRLIKIIEITDGLSMFENCALGLKNCSDEHPCPLHDSFAAQRKALYQLYSSKTISDLVKTIESGNAFIRNL
jgi:Rrf2 family protein